ncbi:MAG: methyltransferase domain-containing protein [Bacteroidales bacterium]|nr:methyltransferase domain-containing protein [Bacteroidales bacterium]
MSLRFGANAQTYNEASDVQRCIALYLVQMLKGKMPERSKVYEIGAGTGHLTRQLILSPSHEVYYVNDVSQEMLDILSEELRKGDYRVNMQCADAETVEWPEGVNLIVSSSAVQWFSDPLNLVRRAAKELPEDGVLAFSTFLPGTYKELSHIGKGLDYPERSAWERVLAECGFEDVAINTEEQQVNFASVRDLLLSIKHSGVQGEGGGQTPYSVLMKLPLRLTYDVIYVVAKRKK